MTALAALNGYSETPKMEDAYMGLVDQCAELFTTLEDLPLAERVATINEIRKRLAEFSPFRAEPVDCVQWVPAEQVEANDYNPNVVAPPEMKLLQLSIEADGYTQPIVANKEGNTFQVVDGFHRHLVGRNVKKISKRISGYLPVVQINSDRQDRNDRIAATIRHNRARGKHTVDGMAQIVLDLKRRNWSDKKIAIELGMDADEVLRLCQITGLAEMFADKEFSEAWEPGTTDDAPPSEEFEELE